MNHLTKKPYLSGSFAKEVQEISSDGKVTGDEIKGLQEKIKTLERQLRRVKKTE